MKNTPPPLRSTSDSNRSLLIAKYPIRILHYAELGVVLGCLLALGIQSINTKINRFEQVVWEDVGPPSPLQPANPGEEVNLDRDADGIPNEWETTHSHNPDFAADAGSDFIIPKGAFSSRNPAVRAALKDMQDLLDELGIDINEPANGVILPKNLAEKYSFDTTYGDGIGPAHSAVHTDNYILALRERIINTNRNPQDVRDAMQKVAIEMSEGGFP